MLNKIVTSLHRLTRCTYLLSQPLGHWYWLLRWPLLLFKWAWVGGLLLAGIYTLTARFTDAAFRLPRKWEGVGIYRAISPNRLDNLPWHEPLL